MNDQTPPSPPPPPDFYRLHTFEKKGPGRRETRNYLFSRGIFLSHPQGSSPLTHAQIEAFFHEERRKRYPEQVPTGT